MELAIAAAVAYLLLARRGAPMNGEANGGAENVQTDIITGGQVWQGPQPALIPTTTGFDADVERSGPDRTGSTIGSGTPAGGITGPGINLNIGGVLNFIGGLLNIVSPALGPAAPLARIGGSVAVAIGKALPKPTAALQPSPSVGGISRVDRDPIEAGLRDIQAGMPGGSTYELDYSRGGFVFEADPATGAGGTGVVETVRGVREYELPALDWGAPEAPESSGGDGYGGNGGYAV